MEITNKIDSYLGEATDDDPGIPGYDVTTPKNCCLICYWGGLSQWHEYRCHNREYSKLEGWLDGGIWVSEFGICPKFKKANKR